jgi:hypothetical protein
MSDGSKTASRGRRAVRRAVDLPCEVVFGDRDEPVVCQARDLSLIGVWLETEAPAEPGDRVVITFRPPNWPSIWNITVFGTVARVSRARRSSDAGTAGIAIEFVDLTDAERAALGDCLKGLPLPQPRPRNT